jgi:hypothetical protein
VVVPYGAPNQETAAVYRRGSAPDKVSVERYPLVNGAWGQRQKDPEKVSARRLTDPQTQSKPLSTRFSFGPGRR